MIPVSLSQYFKLPSYQSSDRQPAGLIYIFGKEHSDNRYAVYAIESGEAINKLVKLFGPDARQWKLINRIKPEHFGLIYTTAEP